MRLYRSMKEDADGLPMVGRSPRMLGVRTGSDPTPDVTASAPSDPVVPGQGGMSVAPGDPMHLQPFRRPPSLGGIGKDPVWWIDTDDLEPELGFRQDRPTHGLVEPRHTMPLQDFEGALAKTRSRWKLYRK
jgi:hypothetical protein